jgi:hypothetical protein
MSRAALKYDRIPNGPNHVGAPETVSARRRGAARMSTEQIIDKLRSDRETTQLISIDARRISAQSSYKYQSGDHTGRHP